MDDFEPVVDHFAHRARVIRMDFRGRGASGFDPDYSHYNVLQESQDVIGLLDHLGLDKAAILGTSRGGLVAMTLAATAQRTGWRASVSTISAR
jgi:pimeloyl-ACP methyl ester carboxylesterase